MKTVLENVCFRTQNGAELMRFIAFILIIFSTPALAGQTVARERAGPRGRFQYLPRFPAGTSHESPRFKFKV